MIAIALVMVSALLHAGWNLLARSQQGDSVFLRVNLVIAAVGLGPALAAQYWAGPFPAPVWGLLALSGLAQTGYYIGLARGYQAGHFSAVYPIVRALPILLLAVVDALRGRAPQPLAWLAMALIAAGCVLVSLPSPGVLQTARSWRKAMLWTLVAALGVVGYSTVDKLAAELIPPGPSTAAVYNVFEAAATVLPLWLAIRWLCKPTAAAKGWAGWKRPAAIALGLFASYWLVLWAYQLSAKASYISALRQVSIVIGVPAGSLLFHEPARAARIVAALVITIGVVCIVLVG